MLLTSSDTKRTLMHLLLFTNSAQSPKFKRVSLNETPELPFWGLNICVDFDLRDSEKMENMKKLNNILFYNKNIDIHKTV